jgi:hypothetical protein
MSPRRPSARNPPQPHRGARSPGAVVGIPDRDDHRPPVFSFEFADRDYSGAWSWPTDAEAGELLRFLCEMSRYTWAEIVGMRWANGGMRHHLQPIETVCLSAQRRITELGHDQRFESLFRFAIGGRKRLWGFCAEGVFYVLWWDACHQVYPLATTG